VELPGGESGNIEHTWGMYNKPTGCSTPAYGAPHKQTNKPNNVSLYLKGKLSVVSGKHGRRLTKDT
jgi:hypothetical protein